MNARIDQPTKYRKHHADPLASTSIFGDLTREFSQGRGHESGIRETVF
jgi:hypothetical protein